MFVDMVLVACNNFDMDTDGQQQSPDSLFSQKQNLQPNSAYFSYPRILAFVLMGTIILGSIGVFFYFGMQKKMVVISRKRPVFYPTKGISIVPTQVVKTIVLADWKTYVNVNVHYSFQYPADWYLYPPEQTTSLDMQTVSPVSFATKDTDGVPAGDYIDISVDGNAKNLTIEQWVKNELQIPITLRQVTINGVVWERTSDYPFFIGGEAAFTKQGQKIFSVSWTKKTNDISIDTFERILASFKFTN